MLERFESINKVGLFDNYTHSPECDFNEVTLIYGENGVGKSTLAAILDSLRERNAEEIKKRRTLPGNITPTVSVRMNNKVYFFNGCDWDDKLPYETLEVFFPGFVTRNVHATTSVEPDNRRNLCEFVLGRIAIEKVQRLAQVDNEGRAALAEIRAIEKDLQLLIKNPDTFETFLNLSDDAKIDEHIENVRAELKNAQSKDAILARAVPNVVALPTVDRIEIAKLLEKSADGIGVDVAAVIKTHINQHLDNDGENWLAYGARHTGTDNKCPFCAQDITGLSLVTTIRSYFSEEYRAYTELLSREILAIKNQLGTASFPDIRTAFLAQVAVASQWADEMPIDQSAIATILTEAEEVWKSAAGKFEAVLRRKQAKPLEKIEPDITQEALAEYEPAIALLVKVNDILSASDKKAQERKDALSKVDTAEIEQRLHRLENQKVRFEPLAQDLIGKRNTHIAKRTTLDREKINLKKEIDENASRVVGKYQAGINHYLEHFGCDIRIESVEPKFPGGKASVHYKLKVHGHEIGLGLSDAEPCFETVLSEGDKYTLALSFFFARMKDYNDLTGRVVVLDDPVNSLGSFRRTLIEGVVRDLRIRGAQVIVLTHDERLAALIWRDKILNKNVVSLQVERTRKGSRLQPWDVERATQSKYVEYYLTLNGFLEHGGDHRPAAACIRPYVEQRLRHLFPGPPFQTRDSLGQMIGKVKKCDNKSRLYALREKLPELESINNASLSSHHATDDVPGMDPLTPEEVRLFAQKALEV